MPPPNLPVEAVEHIISFLREDVPSLAACSLAGHALLPIARAELWHEVALSVEQDCSPSARTIALLDLLAHSPALVRYVRSLVLRPRSTDKRDHPYLESAAWYTLSAPFPLLRSLHLRNFDIRSLYDVVSIIRARPALESLFLEQVSMGFNEAPAWPHPPTQMVAGPAGAYGPPPVWALRKLSIVGGTMPGAEVSRLALFLEKASQYTPLQSLDLRCTIKPCDPALPGDFPRVPVAVPLRYLGITLTDIYDQDIVQEGREHTHRTIGALPRYSASLRSLCLQYDRRTAYLMSAFRAQGSSTPPEHTPTPFFLELLADVLSISDRPSLPLLESLTLDFLSPPTWLVGFEAAFNRLADALVGDAVDGSDGAREDAVKRYPRFSQLEVRTSSLAMFNQWLGGRKVEEEPEALETEKETLVLPMLVRFVRAGVHVEVLCSAT